MKRLSSTLPNMILSLGTITIIAGLLLGYVYTQTKEPITKQQAEAQIKAIAEVAPTFDNNPEADKWATVIEGDSVTVYPAYENGQLAGAAVKASSMEGFNGLVEIMTGFDVDGTVREFRVISQAETPGLGAKMEAWFHDPKAARSIVGKNPASISFYVVKDTEKHGEIDGITAATISSRAFLSAVRDSYDAFMKYKEEVKK